MGFLVQNTAATAVGLGAGFISYHLLNQSSLEMVATIAACGYLGGHLPHIQQPSQPSYRIIRAASWLATLLIPLSIFLYRPADLLPAWLVAFLFTSGLWMIIDRVSLQRDYTHSVAGIILLPLAMAGCAYLALGAGIIIPAFLAGSVGYIVYLLLDAQAKRNWLQTLKKPSGEIEN
ncbi:MAG: hypothetical protein R3F02_15445 [Thiolinea sp.]